MYKAFRSVRRPLSRLILHWRGLGKNSLVLFIIERHTDTLASGWFHSVSPYGAVCYIHRIWTRGGIILLCTDSSPTTKSVGLSLDQCACVSAVSKTCNQINYHPQSGWFEDEALKGGTEAGYPLKGVEEGTSLLGAEKRMGPHDRASLISSWYGVPLVRRSPRCAWGWGVAWDAGLPHKTLLQPPNAGTAEPVRVSPPEAVAYPLELMVICCGHSNPPCTRNDCLRTGCRWRGRALGLTSSSAPPAPPQGVDRSNFPAGVLPQGQTCAAPSSS